MNDCFPAGKRTSIPWWPPCARAASSSAATRSSSPVAATLKAFFAHCVSFRQGARGEEFYVIRKGQADVFARALMAHCLLFSSPLAMRSRRQTARRRRSPRSRFSFSFSNLAASLGSKAGDHFGEGALLRDEPRAATVVAMPGAHARSDMRSCPARA